MDTPLEDWLKDFDPRQQKQIKWSQLYDTDDFRHGDDGHNAKLIIAKMSGKLRHYESLLNNHGVPLHPPTGEEDHG